MPLSTENLRCLVVEDDKFKLDSVLGFLRGEFGDDAEILTCNALSTAVVAIAQHEFHLVLIDMSIPSHPSSIGDGSAYPLPSGGLDVLFEIDLRKNGCASIILTQYPEIEIDGALVPVAIAAEEILRKFSIGVAGCIQYFDDNLDWQTEIRNIVRDL